MALSAVNIGLLLLLFLYG